MDINLSNSKVIFLMKFLFVIIFYLALGSNLLASNIIFVDGNDLYYDTYSDDIDIDYDNKTFKIKEDNLIIPHISMKHRNFVLLPLLEINQSWKHPKLKITKTK